MRSHPFQRSEGFAMVVALLILMFLSAISIGMVYLANSETRAYTSDIEYTQAYYANEAAMEKMMVDLSNLYLSNQTPSATQIQALGTSPPSISGVTFPEYQFIVPNTSGVPNYTVRTISSGANQGLIAEIIPITLSSVAQRNGRAEVKMTRDIEVALIPVFQFGMFSDTDLSYFPGSNITFAGRVHTNGNLFLAVDDGVTVVFRSKLSAAGASASVIADAVITLSKNWNNLNSFNSPTSTSGRAAQTAYQRVAIAGGKNRCFPHPGIPQQTCGWWHS